MNDVTSSRGGAGRGQGRKPISPDGAKAYKLLLTDEQRAKLETLGNAGWIREQIDFATHLEQIDMTKAVNLSARYINALRQLEQFHSVLPFDGPLTHMYSGVRVLPTGDLTDPDDDSGILQLVFPGGHTVDVIGAAYLEMMAKESAEIEVATKPDDLGIPERKMTHVQLRTADLLRHLSGKHGLDL
ncbi:MULTISPECIES: hypothetical protein [Comamonas]|uniref:hypothetical protein n=1 Tax=Comamonas TaxID=283 RepID=UPI00237EC288|nr:hypothetical protein [Comamonas aquatica]MDE1555345.1 hypothetical protein [Comamonas aquatica]